MADSSEPIKIRTQGGELSVTVKMKGEKVEKAYMSGPAQFVFEGDV
jgi:diaminopimelate epimerase